MKVQFNKSVVQSLSIGSHQDTKCPGLILTVTEHSRRFGIYVSVKSMPTRKAIGPIEEWSVEAARLRAGEIIRELRSAKPKGPATPTLQDLAESYTRRLEVQGKRDTTYIMSALRLSWSKIVTRKIDSITKGEIQDIHDQIAVKRGKSAAASAVQVLRILFNYAIADELLLRNPASRVVLYPANSRDIFLNAAELEVLREVLMDMPVDVSDYFLLILNTGLRKSNAAGLKWDWIDGDIVTIPASDSKNGYEMTIPLSQEAQGIQPIPLPRFAPSAFFLRHSGSECILFKASACLLSHSGSLLHPATPSPPSVIFVSLAIRSPAERNSAIMIFSSSQARSQVSSVSNTTAVRLNSE